MRNKQYDKYFVYSLYVFVLGVYTLLFLKRVIYPDLSYDTANYHFFLGKNGFDNFPYFFKPSEFYPLGMHNLNPIADIINYFFYSILGYRLGTLLSMFSLVGMFIVGMLISRDLFSKYLEKKELFAVYLLLIAPVFIVNESLFQVASYFTDNSYVLLSMTCLFVLLKIINIKKEAFFVSFVLILGLLIGLMMTKLTNFIYVIPFSLVIIYFIYERYINKKEKLFKKFIAALFLFGLPIALVNYFMIINFLKTGNPFFMYYNGIFKSIYYPFENWSFNIGPTTLSQKIFYPFYALKNPILLGEAKEVFPDVKVLIIFFYILISYLFLVFKKIKFYKKENIFLIIFFISFLLWQVQFGYSRYAIFLEILGGLISIFLAFKIFISENLWHPIKMITILFVIFMVLQSMGIIWFNYRWDISWRSTPTFSKWMGDFFSRKIFYKYTIINDNTNRGLEDVDIILQCINPTSLYFSTIDNLKNKPMLNIDSATNYYLTRDIEYANKRDQSVFDSLGKKSLNFAIVLNDNDGLSSDKDRGNCFNAIEDENKKEKKIFLKNEFSVDNFIGDKNFKLTILTGNYQIKNN